MRAFIGSLLAPLADVVFTVMHAIPLGAVRAFVFMILAVTALWVLSLPPQRSDGSTRSDLRFFALFVLGLQAVIYMIF
jgi:hypothetical protein